MSLDQIPPTPRFDDQLEQMLRNRAEQRAARSRRGVRSRRLVLAPVAIAVVIVVVVLLLIGGHDQDDRTVTSPGPQPSTTDEPDRSPGGRNPSSSETSETTESTERTERTETTRTTQTSRTTESTETTPTTESPTESPATPGDTAAVPGRASGSPPCAPASSTGDERASVSHPERAPLIAQSSFPGGVRWALCGASAVFEAAILNLRSDDGGATWSVSDTGIGLVRSHAGDRVDVTFVDATTAEMHVVSLVGERDERHRTTDGGLTWR
jgi:hypothetical protein